MAAFDWLDFATRTDACGSLRSPAAVEGLFTMRPSHGLASVEGIIPWGSEFDTFGGFACDLATLESISDVLDRSPVDGFCISKPKKIYCPTDFWPVANKEQRALFDDFIARLEIYTGTECVPISLDHNWRENNAAGTDKSLVEYFNNTLPWAYTPTQHQTYTSFRDDYVDEFGHEPYFNPEAHFKMEWLPTVSPDMHKQATTQLGVFREWFEDNIIPASKKGESEALLLIP